MPKHNRIDKSALKFGEASRVREPAYLEWLAERPCCVTGRRPVVVHHPRVGGDAAAGRKCSDAFCVPLHPSEHAGRWSVHGDLGERGYWLSKGLCLLTVQFGLRQRYARYVAESKSLVTEVPA